MKKCVIFSIFATAALLCVSSCLQKADVDLSGFYKSNTDDPGGGGGGGEGSGANTVTVMSFNLRNYASDAGTSNSWDNRKKGVYSCIRKKCPVIIGTQEGYITQTADIKKNCSYYDYYGLGRDNGTINGETTAIFYLKDSVSVKDYGTFWLSATPGEPSLGWDAACKRTCTWMKFEMKSTQQQFYVFNTHLDHKGSQAKEKGAALVLDRIKSINIQNLPVFLTGDMNSLPDDAVISTISATLGNARTDAPITDNFGSSNGFGNGTPTQIDYVFYNGCKATRFETVRDRWEGITYISDHFPIMATFKYGEQ